MQKEPFQSSHLFYIHEKRTWKRKFSDAFRGLGQSVKQQSSYKVHIFFMVMVPLLGLFLRLDVLQWCMLILCITVVVAAEMFNTSIETLSRAVTQEENAFVGRSLDIASGAVLTVSIGASLVGTIIFLSAFLRCGFAG
ncbi:MAG: diacylglycerol kinase family protein [Planctomycetaceae bacterium]|nr:diacylglycerol kinase family protein [Planctomycetaceae bacterium]